MNSPGSRPRNTKPTAPSDAKKGLGQALRVLGGEGGRAAPSIIMPRAKTELSALLAGDSAVCLRRPSSAAAQVPIAQGAAAPMPANVTADSDLVRLTELWPSLPRNIRAAICTLVRETATGESS